MAAANLNQVQMESAVAALGLLLAALVLPWRPLGRLLEQRTRLLPALRRLAARRACAFIVVGLAAFTGSALVGWWRPPLPVAPDEFSYLLGADTFAAGRLANPTPVLWQQFQTPEVLLRPTYQSKYPPAQALFLALGQRLMGRPAAGVWLSSALACAALCWMLQAWTTDAWALYGSLLAVLQLAFFGHWAQSYWGGMVAALGAALLYGALRRIAAPTTAWARVRLSLWLAVGLLILANTRPFEGLLAAIPALAGLFALFLRAWDGRRRFALEVVAPAAALLLLGAGLMLAYNQRVTGSRWSLPYQVYERQYDAVPNFLFQRLRPWPQLQDASMKAAAVDTLAAWRLARGSYRIAFAASKLFGFWQFAYGAALSLPFVLLPWAERRTLTQRILQAVVFFVVQGLALERFLFWPSPSPFWITVLLLALLAQAALLVAYFPGFWERIALSAMGLVAAGLLLETWRFHSHYMAPVVPLAFVLVIQAIRRVWEWTYAGHAPGRILALVLPLLVLATAAAAGVSARGPLASWAQQRAALLRRLESLPGPQLVIVHYGPRHDFDEEWVHNRADFQRARVLWAREGGARENCRLMAAYSGRTAWLLDADHAQLEKYAPDCAAGKTQPASSVPQLESLPDQ